MLLVRQELIPHTWPLPHLLPFLDKQCVTIQHSPVAPCVCMCVAQLSGWVNDGDDLVLHFLLSPQQHEAISTCTSAVWLNQAGLGVAAGWRPIWGGCCALEGHATAVCLVQGHGRLHPSCWKWDLAFW
jgi:hypothetical protein